MRLLRTKTIYLFQNTVPQSVWLRLLSAGSPYTSEMRKTSQEMFGYLVNIRKIHVVSKVQQLV